MTQTDKVKQIKTLISDLADESSKSELSSLLEISAFANAEYNKHLDVRNIDNE